ncbi:ATP-grasp domain-containing protein [Paenibacillus athensensis]|uniref:Phosphoribosylaminoimidazole carboxylase (NCAIR synthetase) n=1 Tax=Paenibacillus athensensis TaxID=1967502 RepID=A0A4Y8Q2B1_9BACL|nr:peptide ligase PGM1-related protein [Paenibacillus athensensis]MCD1258655.1 ATP-grasp domain-containing protein [Paenibacillus athensensis]
MTQQFDLIRYLTTEREQGVIVWLLNIGAEKYWNRVSAGIVDRNEDRIVNRVEEMNLLLCREQDVLIVREQPDAAYLDQLRAWGLSVPRFLSPEEVDGLTPIAELALKDEKLLQELAQLAASRDDVFFVPYGVTYLEEQIAEKTGLRLMGAPSAVNAKVNDKIFNREIAEELGLDTCVGRVCSSMDEIREEYARLTQGENAFEKVIIKEPHGASGKGLYIIDHPDKLSSLLTRLGRTARNNPDARWLIEGWYNKKADINYQIYVSPSGEVTTFSIKQQILRDTVYIGSKLPADVSPEVAEAYAQHGKVIGDYLYKMGYSGVAGIDSIITSDDRIIPIIEINGRFTLSTYISFIEHTFGSMKVFSRYFKLMSDTSCDFQELYSALTREGLAYNADTREGVIVYTSGTLPVRQDEGGTGYTGRMFTLIAAQSWEQVDELSSKLEDFVSRVSNRVLA